ncbi:phenylacetate--CoA ligase family protein [Azohydromonas lata]|uniref:AMP-binding protein n=1 Tax=Azohydromonas lata TaxID=45677 RepID=A0ABU5I8G7_9BURK|nr:AMP-binding protein [Azohydromonas lata]MDZ5455387.1 AMP-binding protein [Azohydromonas lata]
MTDFYDALETREPAAREAALLAALPGVVAQAQAHSSAAAELLAGVDAREVTSRAALAQLPVLRKSELLRRQRERRHGDPFGGLATVGWRGLARPQGARRVFQSPGPIYEPEGEAADWWRMARALFAAGFRSGDLVHNSFSYHLTPAGSIMETGAHALGCTVFPGGVGNTELQLQAMAELGPHGYVGTPSFLKILLERAAEQQIALPSLVKALVSGEACPPSLRAFFAEHGVQAFQCYATADLGLIAYETAAREGLVVDEGVIVEIVQPGGSEPVAPGDIGEVVVTTLNPDYPLIRFGTGDLSAVLPGECPSGRTNVRLRGWLGRADQATKVRGMFVHPGQLAQVAQRHPGLGRLRLVVSGEPAAERLLLRVEIPQAQAPAGELAQQLAASVREVTKLRAEVELCAPGSLPDDGKVIEDGRRYE